MKPVHVLTGFLGSGKTTLIREILSDPAFTDSAVIVNEFGEVGLDHLLLEEVEEGVLLLRNGCVCCTVRSDLKETIRDLQDREDQGSLPPFARVILETTGLADPAPVLSTLLADPVLRHHFGIGNIVCTVDAVLGARTLKTQPESLAQVAAADRIVITKCDLVSKADHKHLRMRLQNLNPAADFGVWPGESSDASGWLRGGAFDPKSRSEEALRWTRMAGDDSGNHLASGDVQSFCLVKANAVDWTAFGIWLTALLHVHGENVLRVKGILNVSGVNTPVVIHGVQHVIHPPLHLESWPGSSRESRVVFITRGLDEACIRNSMDAFIGCMEAST